MPSVRYVLEKGGPKRLHVTWKGSYKKLQLALDNQLIGQVDDPNELKQGCDFALPDGSTLSVRLRRQFLWQVLELRRDGEHLPGTATDPESNLRYAMWVIYFVGALSIVLGGLAAFAQVDILVEAGFGVIELAVGFVFLLLGYLTWRRVLLALYAAIGLYGALTLLNVWRWQKAAARAWVSLWCACSCCTPCSRGWAPSTS